MSLIDYIIHAKENGIMSAIDMFVWRASMALDGAWFNVFNGFNY